MKSLVVKIVIIIATISMVAGVYFIKQSVSSKSESVTEDFITDKKATKMINFIEENCYACVKMEGLMKEIISEYEGVAEIAEVDVMENSELANKYNIMYTPTQIFFDEDGNEIYRHEGFIGKKDLVKKFAELGVST